MSQKPIVIYTDGSALGNPGPGGWGAVLKYGNHRKTFSGGYYRTTNNRMELMAIIQGLRQIKKSGHPIIVYSDSQYLTNAVNKGWVFNWEKKNFKNRKNADLWREFLKLYRQYNITLDWVRGHVGVEENEVCDKLAKEAAENPTQEDTGYVQSQQANGDVV